MKKRLLARMHGILIVLLFLHSTLPAQKRSVSGRVTDAKDGSPLQGGTVQAKGSNSGGVVTGADGRFTLPVEANGKTLAFSFVGYSSIERPIGSGNLEVVLTATTANLNEIVIIGYGTARKKDLTGAVAVVSEKDFQKGSITTPEQMIAGKVPGVSIISNGGQPGAGSTIRIRGGSSLNASNDPLIVIDGVPMDNEIPPVAGQKSVIPGAGNPLSFINPNDIETFTVLKDASAAAIYGTRAANGVILISTRKGSSGKLAVTFTTSLSVSGIAKKVDVLSA